MSYFGVSNPELNSPFYGIGAAKRGRARAQRKRFTHTQMAGRNGGFADPREIMAYHNKGELSDGATIQALSLFGIGAAGARKMISDSRRSNQQAAMMGVRRQQASLRGFAGRVNQLGNPNNAVIYDDSRGGSWRIEKTLESQYGSTLRYSYRAISLDSDAKLGPFTIQGSFQTINPMLEDQAKANIEAYIATIPIDDDEEEEVVDDNGSDAWLDGDGNNANGGDATGNGNVPSDVVEYRGYYYQVADMGNLGNGWAYSVYPPEASSGEYFDWRSLLVIKDGFDTSSSATAGAQSWIDAEVGGQSPPSGDQLEEEDTTQTFTFQHTAVPDMPSTWTIVVDKHVSGPPLYFTNYKYTASSSEWEFGISSSMFENHATLASAKAAAEQKIHNSVMQSIAANSQNGDENDSETGGNGSETGGNGSGITIAEGYDNDTDVIDGYKLGVIGYREAHNTLVLQFGYSENEASEALRTESSVNDWVSDTDGDTFRETEQVVTQPQPVQVQTQEVVPAPLPSPSFIEENKVALAGGAILVAGAAAMAYSNRRN
tara:strand:+ start:1238 stop:2869 length:1632 start_codon:yes stop_codon:yes gene_type:complete